MKTTLQLVLLGLILNLTNSCRTRDIVKTEGITSALHKANVGRIVFTSGEVPPARMLDSDLLENYTLTSNSKLFITAFMGNSITNYLHLLAPEMTADDLNRKGNYQFSMFVDNHRVYTSNLQPGAPYRKIKDTATLLSVPLISYRRGGWLWSQFFWMRFMNNGGDSALTEGKHTLRMEIRPYLETKAGIKEGDIVASGSLNLLVNRKPTIDLSKIRLDPVIPYPGLAVSGDAFNKDLIKALKGNINEGVFKDISSIVVLKDGKLLIEEYFNGETRDSLHDPRSATKSISSTISGIAIHDRYLKDEGQTLNEFYDLRKYDNYAQAKEEISIRDLLTMSCILDGNDDDGDSPGNEENMYPTADWVRFTLSLPVSQERPKEEWHYFTAGVVLLGDILNKVTPGGLEKYSDTKLFSPLGITRYKWQYTPKGVPNTAGGLKMNSLDFAKYGQLYANRGKWNGKQLVPAEWIGKTFTRHKVIPGRINEFYGYLFWDKTYTVNGRQFETYYCAGNGGNKIYVFPGQPWVIVITATAYGAPYAHSQEDRMMTEFIIPALINCKK